MDCQLSSKLSSLSSVKLGCISVSSLLQDELCRGWWIESLSESDCSPGLPSPACVEYITHSWRTRNSLPSTFDVFVTLFVTMASQQWARILLFHYWLVLSRWRNIELRGAAPTLPGRVSYLRAGASLQLYSSRSMSSSSSSTSGL